MPGDAIAVIQVCKVCASEVGTFSEKKENLMLATVDHVWCEACKAVMPGRPAISPDAGRLSQERWRATPGCSRYRRVEMASLRGSIAGTEVRAALPQGPVVSPLSPACRPTLQAAV